MPTAPGHVGEGTAILDVAGCGDIRDADHGVEDVEGPGRSGIVQQVIHACGPTPTNAIDIYYTPRRVWIRRKPKHIDANWYIMAMLA